MRAEFGPCIIVLECGVCVCVCHTCVCVVPIFYGEIAADWMHLSVALHPNTYVDRHSCGIMMTMRWRCCEINVINVVGEIHRYR